MIDASGTYEFNAAHGLAILREPLSCGKQPKAIGCYDPSNRMISVSRKAIFPDPAKEGDAIAHEIAHAIINHYFVVPPSVKMQEILSGYVEYSLNKKVAAPKVRF